MASDHEVGVSPSPGVDIMNDPAYSPNSSRNPTDQEPDHCRICRSEGTMEEPLYHPCKCSGSIKFVHQECLMEWLQHSQKKYCELCKTPFHFTKVYDPEMPPTLPTPLFLRQLVLRLGRGVVFWARAVLVGSVWLGCLPWSVRWMWRGWFWVSDGGWWQLQVGVPAAEVLTSTVTTQPQSCGTSAANGRSIIESLSSPGLLAMMSPINGGASVVAAGAMVGNATEISARYPDGIFFDHNPFFNTTRFQFINHLIIDVLEGQLLTALIVFSFIIVFLIREWVVQQQPALVGDVIDMPLLNEQVPGLGPNVAAAGPDADIAGHGGDQGGGNDDEWLERVFDAERNDHDDGNEGVEHETEGAEIPQQRVIARPRRRRRPVMDAENNATQETMDENFNFDPITNDEENARAASTGFNFAQRPTPTRENTAQVTNLRRDLEETTRSVSTNSVYDFGGTGRSTDNLFQFGGGNPEQSRPTMWTRESSETIDIVDRLETIDTGRTREWMRENMSSGPASPVATDHRVSDLGSKPGSRDGGIARSATASWGSISSFEMIAGSGGNGKGIQGISLDISTGKGKEKQALTSDKDLSGDEDGLTAEGSIALGTSEWSTTAQAGDTPVPSESSSTPPPPPSPRRMYPDHFYERRSGPSLPVHSHKELEMIEDARRIEEIRNTIIQRNLPEVQQAQDSARDVEHLLQDTAPQALVDDVPPQRLQDPAPIEAQIENANVQQQVGRGGFLDWLIGEEEPLDALNEQNPNANDEVDDEEEQADAEGIPQAIVDDDAGDDFDGILELVGMRGPILGLVQNTSISILLITATVAVGVAFPYVTGKTVMMILAHPILFFFKLPTMAISFCAEFLVDSTTMIGFTLLLALDHAVKFFVKPASYITPNLSRYASNVSVTNFLKNWATDGQNRVFAKFTSIETTYIAIRKYPPSAVPPLSLVVKESHERLFHSIIWGLERLGLTGLAATKISAGPEELNLKGIKVANPVVWAIHAWEDTIAAINFTQISNSTEIPTFGGQQILRYPGVYKWSTWDRVGVVLLGYAFFTVVGMIYVKRRRSDFASSVERLVVEFLQQCGGVMKVVLIIGIEMFLFPLYCGALLDIATLPLFESATFVARIQFAVDFPLTNVFVHWFVGTCYMFHFALFVSMCRKIMSTGVLYFIRDPDDPTFHPVRDVLNRPVITQLRKIAFSAFIYGVLVLMCLGGVVWGLHGATQNVLPIHWSSNEPVFEFPVDLLFYNFLMPLAVKFFKPSDGLQKMYGWWFQRCARALRLSSFMFGERNKDEEGYICYPTWTSMIMGGKADFDNPVLPDEQPPLNRVYFQRNGRFVRAPASDSVRRPRGASIFIPVDESNRQLDVEPAADPPDGPTGADNPDWRLAYIPPYFRVRIGFVVVGIWVFAAVTGIGVTIGPLLLGRAVLRQIVPGFVRLNDIYAFSVGIYILGGIVLSLSKLPIAVAYVKGLVRPLATAASNATSYPENLNSIRISLQQLVFRTLKVGYVLTAFAVVIPTLVALIIELYFIIPLHTAFGNSAFTAATAAAEAASQHINATSTTTTTTAAASIAIPSVQQHLGHTIHFVQDWTLGVLYVKMMGKMMLLDDNSIWARSLRGIIQHGWLNPDAKLATRVFIAPCVGGTAVALLLPLALARLALMCGVGEDVRVYRFAFPMVLALACFAAAVYTAWRVVGGWKEKVRDEVYLRGMRIHNHGEERAPLMRTGYEEESAGTAAVEVR